MNREEDGSWTLFVPGLEEWTIYKYRIHQLSGEWAEKVILMLFILRCDQNRVISWLI